MSGQTSGLAWPGMARCNPGAVEAAGVWSFSPRLSVSYALLWQAATFTLLMVQFVLMCAFGPAAILPGLIGLPLLFLYRPLAGVTVFLQVLLYQNLFLSIACGIGMDPGAFQAAQGLAFAVVCGMAAISVGRLLRERATGGRAAGLVRIVCVSLAVCVVYTVYGTAESSPASALTNFRNTAAMLLALVVGVDAGLRWDYSTVAVIFLASIVVGLLTSCIELFAPVAYYTAVSGREYIHMRAPAGTDIPEISRSVDEIVRARMVTWFNVTGGAGDWKSVRINGPNMLAVSYAYVIGCVGIAGLSLGRAAIACIAFCLLVAAGVKGPLIMLTLTMLLTALWWVTRHKSLMLFASLGLLLAYVVLGIKTGMADGDFHVIGLLGGWRGFLNKPWGHGIGVGGNLSAAALTEGIDWQTWQHEGADFAVESAVGVLIYQMGVAACAVYVPIVALLRTGFDRPRFQSFRRSGAAVPLPTDALFIGIAVILFNGFFQEEAYSPYALGLLALLGGVAAGNVMRALPRHAELKA